MFRVRANPRTRAAFARGDSIVVVNTIEPGRGPGNDAYVNLTGLPQLVWGRTLQDVFFPTWVSAAARTWALG